MRKFNVTVNGVSYEVDIEEVGGNATSMPTTNAPKAIPVSQPKPAAKVAANGTKINAPMPGTILKISAKEGAVKKGDVLFVLEAMKMENDIVAPIDGMITINVVEGSTISSGDLLAVIA